MPPRQRRAPTVRVDADVRVTTAPATAARRAGTARKGPPASRVVNIIQNCQCPPATAQDMAATALPAGLVAPQQEAAAATLADMLARIPARFSEVPATALSARDKKRHLPFFLQAVVPRMVDVGPDAYVEVAREVGAGAYVGVGVQLAATLIARHVCILKGQSVDALDMAVREDSVLDTEPAPLGGRRAIASDLREIALGMHRALQMLHSMAAREPSLTARLSAVTKAIPIASGFPEFLGGLLRLYALIA